jgi:N-methylhydantoinase A/oxoprolinase/acetone carboxylase beta subunit
MAYGAKARGFVEHQVYGMEGLPDGAVLAGPAIIEDASSTLVVGAGARARVDGRGFIEVTL